MPSIRGTIEYILNRLKWDDRAIFIVHIWKWLSTLTFINHPNFESNFRSKKTNVNRFVGGTHFRQSLKKIFIVCVEIYGWDMKK